MLLIRSLLFNIWFFGSTFVFGSYGIWVRRFAKHRALGVAMAWASCVLAGARVIAGIEVKLSGAEHLPAQGPLLIASQHQSAFDTLIWLKLLPRACYVLKQELTFIPLFGALLRPAGQIVVDRGGGANAVRSLLREGKRAKADDRQIVIFPEGTRAPFGSDLPVQPGVMALSSQLKMSVLPVATDSGLRWGRRAFFKHPGPVNIRIMPPIPAGTPKAEIATLLKQRWAEAGLHKP